MILGKFTLAMFLLTAPAVWAQFSKADMMKLATDRFDTASPAQGSVNCNNSDLL